MPKRSESERLFSQAQLLFPGGVNSPVRAFTSVGGNPFFVARGEGAYLIDVDGNRYIDYINSWGPLVLGHAPLVVQDALRLQASLGTTYGAPSPLEIELAQLIQTHVPSIEMMRFVSSGTEAGMAVIRLARGVTGRPKLLKFSGCYHGHADSLLVSAGSGIATLSLPDSPGVLASLAKETLVAPFNNLSEVRSRIAGHESSIAAVLVEPVMGNAGFILPEPGFLSGLRTICDDIGALLVFDEVMTGFRVDLRGAQGVFEVVPDLTLLGKVIGGGLPVGLYGGKRHLMEHIAPSGSIYQAGTLSGNPLAMASGLATLSTWVKGGYFSDTAKKVSFLVDSLKELAVHYKIPFSAASLGTMFGFFFHSGPVRSYEDARHSSQELFQQFFWKMLELGVFFPPSRFEACFASAAHDDDVISKTVECAKEAFASLA